MFPAIFEQIDMPPPLAFSQSEGLLEESDGAKVVFLEGFESRDGTSQPLLVKKSDGGFM